MKVLLLLLGLAGSAWFLSSTSASADDPRVSFYGNGQRKASLVYADGRPHGPAMEWYADGSLSREGRYEHGLREGEWRFWRADGTLDKERSGTYAAGRRVD